MDFISFSETEAGQQFQNILAAKEDCAIAGARLLPTFWRSLGNALAGDAEGYFLVIALDAYRKSVFQEAKDALLSDVDEGIRRRIRLTTSYQIDLAYIDYASNGRHADLRETFRRCRAIFIILTDMDLGSTALAHWEWIQACVVGKSPLSHYLVPTHSLTERLQGWLEKHGVKSLHIAQNVATPSSSCDDTSNDAHPRRHKLIFSAPTKCRALTHDALISHYHYNSLNQIAEAIHRRHATTHAFYAHGDRRPPFAAHDASFCCFPALDALPDGTWKHYFALSPDMTSAWKCSVSAVSCDESGVLCATPEATLAACAMLSVDAVSDDLDTMAPGHLARTLVGTYILYTRLYFGLPLPAPLTPELGSFVPPLINALLCYWKSAGIIGVLSSGCYGLTDRGAKIFTTPKDVLQCGGQWLRSNWILHVLPDQTPLGFIHELVTRWNRGGTYAFGDAIYAPASQEWSEMGTNVLYSAKQPMRRDWIDATTALLSFEEASWIRAQLLAQEPDFSAFEADKKTKECLHGVLELHADVVSPKNSVVECQGNLAKWWTFGGAILNAVLCALLRCDDRVSSCAFGNCAILLTFKPSADDTPIPRILQDCVSRAACTEDAFADALAQYWFWPISAQRWLDLVGPKWQRGYLRHVLSKLSPRLLALPPAACIPVDTLHNLMETTDPIFTAPKESHAAPTAARTTQETRMTEKNSPNEPREEAPTNAPMAYYRLERGDGSMMHTRLPWSMIQKDDDYRRAIDHILAEPFIGLDVETTLFDHQLCLVQIGCHDQTFIIDPFCVDVHALDVVFSNPNIIKIIHNKNFECSVLGRLGMSIYNIIDTLKVSRTVHPHEKCHKLMEVCLREFNYTMDKTNQQSRWDRRPLSPDQLEYAALDAEIMIHLYCHYFGFPR